MSNKKVKWLIYTVLVGLIPILIRLFIYFVINNNSINLLSASDFISLGLVIHISIINEIEHFEYSDTSWKTIINGMSIVFIAVYSVLFALIIINEGTESIINIETINFCTPVLSFVSFLLSYAVYDRLLCFDKDNIE